MSQGVSFQCPNCGSPLAFDPAVGAQRCAACGSVFAPPGPDAGGPVGGGPGGGAADGRLTGDIGQSGRRQTPPAARPEAAAGPAREAGSGLSQAECRNCGAQIITATATRASTFCAYCHSPVVLTGQLSQDLAPDTVVPFAIGADQALRIFDAWISKKRYVAPGFYSRERVDRLDGVYFPYFAIDARADLRVEGTAHYSTGSGRRTHHHYFHVMREGEVQVENLPQEALRASRADKMINRLLPWNMTRQEPFRAEYLAGFQTERRDLDFEQVAAEAAYQVDLAGRRLLATDVFGRDRRFRDLRLWGVSQIREWRRRYTLLPAWVLFYIAPGGELYYFGVNGQTGEAVGRLPLNRGKLLRDSILLSIAGVLVVVLGFWLRWLVGW
ncbi:MAG: TFIIB-type zinc ribbon-containing protein [Bifidobacteriaceae bacterium]|jgi:DNA-directed RNA polymerase subunit RPC12/RpoP|nr:TFIIB-type zinc ribbon-containing protein [Bifidobacteriaceae bacterium]